MGWRGKKGSRGGWVVVQKNLNYIAILVEKAKQKGPTYTTPETKERHLANNLKVSRHGCSDVRYK